MAAGAAGGGARRPGSRRTAAGGGVAARLAGALHVDVKKAAELLALYGSEEAAVAFFFAQDVGSAGVGGGAKAPPAFDEPEPETQPSRDTI